MRNAEARVPLAVTAARDGDLEGALIPGARALQANRQNGSRAPPRIEDTPVSTLLTGDPMAQSTHAARARFL
jgi:hypothetical protein